MQYHHVNYEKLVRFCVESFKGYGFKQEEAEQITAVLLEADLSGIESHGVQRMIRIESQSFLILQLGVQGKIHTSKAALHLSMEQTGDLSAERLQNTGGDGGHLVLVLAFLDVKQNDMTDHSSIASSAFS